MTAPLPRQAGESDTDYAERIRKWEGSIPGNKKNGPAGAGTPSGAKTPKKEIEMSTQQSTAPEFTKPAWATDIEELGDSAGAVTWSRSLREGTNLLVNLVGFQDVEGTDEPRLRIRIGGHLVEAGDEVLEPTAVAEIALGLLIAARKAQIITAAETLTFERDDETQSLEAEIPSELTHWSHYVTVEHTGVARVLAAHVEELSVEDARRYIVELARAVAIAEAAA